MNTNEIQPYQEKVAALSVSSPEDLKEAANLLTELNTFKDRITDEKDKVMRPLLDAINAERKRWKPIETKLDDAITKVRGAISKYQTQITAEAKSKEEKIAARIEKGTMKLDTAVRKMNEIDQPETSIEAENGSLKFRTDRKFEVTDITKVPYEYLLPDMPGIRAAMKAGKELPGIRYWDEQSPVHYRDK